MSAQQDDDRQSRFALGLVFTLVGVVVATVIGAVLFQQGVFKNALTRQQERVLAESVAPLVGDAGEARVEVAEGVVRFYFGLGSADIAAGADRALADVVQGVEAGRRAIISGFHDASGDAARNAELAKERAQGVANVLLTLGVPADRISFAKPAETTGSGSAAEARRVEVTLAD